MGFLQHENARFWGALHCFFVGVACISSRHYEGNEDFDMMNEFDVDL